MAGQRKSRGYQASFLDARFARNPDGKLELAGGILSKEVDTYTCLHCQNIVEKPPFMQATDGVLGHYCHICNGPVCGRTWECRKWHDNGNMTARQFVETVNEKFERVRQNHSWL